MKKNSTIILPVAVATVFAIAGSVAIAAGDAPITPGSGSPAGVAQYGNSSDEDAKLQSLYNEEDQAALEKMLSSEDYIFPTSLTDNWHVDLQFGAQTTWGSYASEQNFLKRTGFAAALAIGKYLTPVNDLRFTFNYGRGAGVRGLDNGITNNYASFKYEEDRYPSPEYWEFDAAGNPTRQWTSEDDQKLFADNHVYNWHTVGFSIHWLPNLTNLIYGYKPDRKFTTSLVTGIGMEHTWGYTEDHLSYISVWAEESKMANPRNLVSLQFGIHFDYALNRRFHLNGEFLYNFLDDSFDGLISDQSWDMHLNSLIGLTYYVGNRNERERDAIPFLDKYTPYFEQLDNTRDDIEDALANRETEVVMKDVVKNVTYTLISFDENEHEVPRLQQNNVFQTAETYKHIPNSKIFISNSNKVDDALFHQRAWSISKLLNQRWQIPLEDVWVAADETEIQRLQIPEVKTYIIFIIND